MDTPLPVMDTEYAMLTSLIPEPADMDVTLRLQTTRQDVTLEARCKISIPGALRVLFFQ